MSSDLSADLSGHLVRYADLVPCRTAFIDTRTPGSTEKENFTIIGAGVSESAEQHVHITEKHGFHIGAARQPFGCVNSQHSHDTAEVFVVHSGHWRLLFGPNKEDGSLEIGPGDVASVPIHMFRGFEKVDQGTGFLFVVLGQDDPGKVTWAPAVFEAAQGHGLKLARGGRLIDTSSGDYTLAEAELEPSLSDEATAALRTPPMEKLAECVVRAGDAVANPDSPIAGWWPHGFNLRLLTLQTGAYVPLHARREAEVLFVQTGTIEVTWDGGAVVLGAGDTFTVPAGLPHGFRNTASVVAEVFVVRGTDSPAMPDFLSRAAA